MCMTSDHCDGESDEELESSEVCIPFKFSMLTFVFMYFLWKAKEKYTFRLLYETYVIRANRF